jgi:hypothetical protein
MEPSSIDAVQVSWLWKLANGLAITVTAGVAYAWKRLDSRVGDLERETVRHDEMAELKDEIKALSQKIDRMNEVAVSQAQRNFEVILDALRSA